MNIKEVKYFQRYTAYIGAWYNQPREWREFMLTFKELNEKNLERAYVWHEGNIEDWSIMDWCGAAAGELGEALNVVKKLNRIRDGYVGRSYEADEEELKDKLVEELADTVIYCFLVANRIDRNIENAVIWKFNETSEKFGFDIKLGEPKVGDGE